MPVAKKKKRLMITLDLETLKMLEEVAQANHQTKSEILEGTFWLVITAKLEADKEDKKVCN